VTQVLVDIGAGIGLFSLAAAARGHSVIAFEMAEKSLQSFQASIAYNGFAKLIKVHQVLPIPSSREFSYCGANNRTE
jgi:FkbM family methyltransferase